VKEVIEKDRIRSIKCLRKGDVERAKKCIICCSRSFEGACQIVRGGEINLSLFSNSLVHQVWGWFPPSNANPDILVELFEDEFGERFQSMVREIDQLEPNLKIDNREEEVKN